MFESIIATYVNLTSASLYLEEEDDTEVGCCCFIKEDNLVVMSTAEVLEIAELTNISAEEVFKTILLHEIGHSLDNELESLMSKCGDWDGDLTEEKFISEVNAWRIADTLIEGEISNYKVLRAWSLDSYSNNNRDWVTKYCPDYF